jgi:hypothetical protein
MVATPILGSSYVTRSPNAADNRMVNLFPEVVPEGGKQAAWLQRAPGLRYLQTLGAGPVRGLWTFTSDRIDPQAGESAKVAYGYAVSATTLYRIDSNWDYTALGTIDGADQVTMTDNGRQMFIAAGTNGYIYNSTYQELAFNTTSGSTTVWNGDLTYVYPNQPVSGSGIPTSATVSNVIYDTTTATFNTTNTSTTISNGDTANIHVGQPVSGTGIPSGAKVASITNSTTFVLSAAATATNTGVTLTFAPFFTLSAAATATNTGVTLTFTPFLTQLTSPFAGAVGCGFLDGWFVFNQPDSQIFWVMDSTGTTVDPLYFASAEGSPDNLVTLIVDHREIWLFGQNSVEVWYDAGLPDFPMARIQGAFNEIGCLAPYSVAKLDNGLFWLGTDARGNGIVYRSKGYSGERVSTHAVEWQIQQYATLSDAVGYTYQQDGHSFYVLNFPNANTTWVYDVATGAWHERAGWENNDFTRTRGNCQMNFNNEIVIGDYRTGEIFAYDPTVYSEAGTTQKWLRSWRALPTGQNDLNRSTQHSLQLDCQAGVGLPGYSQEDVNAIIYIYDRAGDYILDRAGSALKIRDYAQYTITLGADPQVMLRWSDDGGHTWSNEHWKSMGKIGQTGYRTIWRRLGMTMKLRDRVYEISGTDPVQIAIMGAELHVSPTNA